MDPTGRFTDLVQRSSDELPLAEAALCIAGHDHALDVDEQLAAIDALVAGVPDRAHLAEHLFTTLGFAGNADDYLDPRNSFLDVVLERRLGIPITLSVVMIEVGRRLGTLVEGIGMPGHFLVRDATSFVDPYHGGARLDADGCRRLFAALQGPAPFDARFLDPVDDRSILARMLANLTRSFMERRPRDAVWPVRLRLAIPGLSVAERRRDATVLGTLGRFREASRAIDALVDDADASLSEDLAREAAAFRARAN